MRYETYKSIQFKRGLPAFGLQGTSKSPPNKFEQGTMNVCVLPPPSPGSFCIFGIQSVAIRCILWGNSVCYGCWSVFTFFIYLFFYFFYFIYFFLGGGWLPREQSDRAGEGVRKEINIDRICKLFPKWVLVHANMTCEESTGWGRCLCASYKIE